jgi:hypothetical protein
MRARDVLTSAAVVGLAAATIGFPLGPGNQTRAVADAGCSAETLRGAYALYGTGNAAGVPLAVMARVTFDGAGHAALTMVESYGGVIDDGVIDGTYSLDPDCRGSMTGTMKHYVRRAAHAGQAHEYRHEIHDVDIVVASGGQKFFWVLVDTYPQATPPGVPAADDPITASGWGDKM